MSKRSKVIFLGTGTSEGVPRVSCLTRDPVTCQVCSSAMKPGSRNRRRNTSIVIRYPHEDGRTRNIVVDVGKFFWHSAIDWFPKFRVDTIDAVLLTHGHADAVGGLDDLRDWTNNVRQAIPIYLRCEDLDVISKMHFYLVDDGLSTGGGGVAKLDFRVIDQEPFFVEGLQFIPLPVEHGEDYTAFGYRVGDFSYVSDASRIPEATAERIAGSEVLVMDALRPQRQHRSHFTLEEAVDQALRFRARRTIFVDMTHDVDHESTNAELAKLCETAGLDVQLGYDGLEIEVGL